MKCIWKCHPRNGGKLGSALTHWGRVTHICVSKLTIIGSENGLTPGRHQAIIWTNAGILLVGPLGTNFDQILIEMYTFSFKKMHLKMSSEKWRPFCLGLNVLIYKTLVRHGLHEVLTHSYTSSQKVNINHRAWYLRYIKIQCKQYYGSEL